MNDNADLVTMSASDIDKLYDEIDALRARIAELEAAQRWIPVSERLPDATNICGAKESFLFSDDCLCTIGGENVNQDYGIGYYWKQPNNTKNNDGWLLYGDEGDLSEHVTHWMPLPQPPEDKC